MSSCKEPCSCRDFPVRVDAASTPAGGTARPHGRVGICNEPIGGVVVHNSARDLACPELWADSLVRSRARRQQGAPPRPHSRTQGPCARRRGGGDGRSRRDRGGRCGAACSQRGDDGGRVRGVQHRLGIGGDGEFGPHTEHAVRMFQKRNGLDVDGVVGRPRWPSCAAARAAATPPAAPVTAPAAAGPASRACRSARRRRRRRLRPGDHAGGQALPVPPRPRPRRRRRPRHLGGGRDERPPRRCSSAPTWAARRGDTASSRRSSPAPTGSPAPRTCTAAATAPSRPPATTARARSPTRCTTRAC